ncbi:hypothetical protein MSIMFI_00317 [Mycobacterium simulans]|nr:hypothetical protein MSIMFI_00317 [Mycobacterium simulans]
MRVGRPGEFTRAAAVVTFVPQSEDTIAFTKLGRSADTALPTASVSLAIPIHKSTTRSFMSHEILFRDIEIAYSLPIYQADGVVE